MRYILKIKGEKMKKILMVGAILLAICISISAVSADEGWSFNFGSSESSNSDGGFFSLNTGTNLLEIQKLQYTIPDGYKENESFRVVGVDANESSFPDDTKETAGQFVNGDDSIIVNVFYRDTAFEEDGYVPAEGAVTEKIAGQNGWITEDEDGVTFDFVKDGKIVEIDTPNEQVLQSILESANNK